MEHVWSPWRFKYVSNASKDTGCVFCNALERTDPHESLIFHRGDHNFLMLNRYPYNNGHIMIAPYQHIANFADAHPESVQEMMLLAQRMVAVMRKVYNPDGFNMGMNLGKCAGAGVADHYHLHLLPRWDGDTNFMTTTAETRVVPEDFPITLQKLMPYFSGNKQTGSGDGV